MTAGQERIAERNVAPIRNDASARQLRLVEWVGVILPVALLVAFEVVREVYLVGFDMSTAHLLGAVVTIAGALAFGVAMFVLIERAHRQVVRRNRELAAINAVSLALQGGLAVEEVIDAALERLIDATGAIECSVTVFARDGAPASEGALTRRVFSAGGPSARVAHDERARIVEIPLLAGQGVLGRMRLVLPPGAPEASVLTSEALSTVGQQLAGAIQTRQLLDDLQGRKRDGHAFYDILVQISSQNPLADILGAIVRYSRDLFAADEAAMGLAETAAGTLEAAGGGRAVGRDDADGMAELGDGTWCVTPSPGHFRGAHDGQLVCPVRSSPEFTSVLEVPLQSAGMSLGDIWIGRRSGPAFTERDRGALATLAGLAAIAINSARARETERAEATLAERDRIAREMHDSLAQVLGATHLRLRALWSRGDLAGAPHARAEVADLADITQEAYRDVREAILGLRQASHVRGLTESLRAYLARYAQQSGITARLEAPDDEPQLTVSEEIQAIRVIQEALTNVRKHAHATEVLVTIAPDPAASGTSIVIHDDGRGFDLGSALLDRDGGYGLHTMRERMELVGGELRIEATPGRGTSVIARVPGHNRSTHPLHAVVTNGAASADSNPAR